MIDLERTRLIAQIDEPNKNYEVNEFLIRLHEDGTLWAGSDSGCSCYDGFNAANYEPYTSVMNLRLRFSTWVGNWGDGSGFEAGAWDTFHKAIDAASR